MNYLSVENISKSFGDRILFKDISFGISKGQKVALVARNGTGKTSLLRMLAELEPPDEGSITYRNQLKVSYLPQESNLAASATVADCLTVNNHIADALLNEKPHYELTEEEQTLLGKIKSVAGKLNVDFFHQQVGVLSGGQQKRLALAKVLLDEADFVIMDEPTNHLDLDMIEWLESFLTTANMTMLLVTHDRYFLDEICDEILELDNGTLYRHKGNYSYYLEKKAERLDNEQASTARAKNIYRTELEWMRKQPRARGTKSKSRIDAFYETEENAKRKTEQNNVQLDINISRIGSKILEIHRVSKSYEDLKLIEGFDYSLRKGEKIGIVGNNGAGKSTLLNIITGKTKPDKGKVVLGETIVPGYFEQQVDELSGQKRVIEVVRDIAEFIPMSGGRKISAAQLLERFLFEPSMHFQYVEKLSGGEKRRLYLLTVLMKNPNLLILDEPTNDLDIETLSVLEDYLASFEGCVIIVTHDRFFMDKVVDHIWVFEGDGKIKVINGNYNDYRLQRKALKREQKKEERNSEPVKPKAESPKKKLTFKERQEYELLEKDIQLLEEEKTMLEKQLSDEGINHEQLMEKAKRIQQIIIEVDNKTLRWLELAEYS